MYNMCTVCCLCVCRGRSQTSEARRDLSNKTSELERYVPYGVPISTSFCDAAVMWKISRANGKGQQGNTHGVRRCRWRRWRFFIRPPHRSRKAAAPSHKDSYLFRPELGNSLVFAGQPQGISSLISSGHLLCHPFRPSNLF